MGTRIAALASSAVAVLALTACGSGGSDAAGSSAARSSAASASSGSTAGMPSAPTATNGTGSAGAGTTGTTAPTPRAPAATYGSSTGTTTRAARPSTGTQGGGQVTGATGGLKVYLEAHLADVNAGDGCDVNIRVDKRVGGYARGSYFAPECEGAAALWAQGANGWSEVWSGQDTPTCATLRSRAPGMPTSIVDRCVGDAGKAEPWRPTR